VSTNLTLSLHHCALPLTEILQSLLNLAEFMERDVEALPISLSILSKALHYRCVAVYVIVECGVGVKN